MLLFAFVATFMLFHRSCLGATDWTQYVNPFIGTEGPVPGSAYNGGNTFPGAVVPFGSVKLGPDTTSFNLTIGQNAGYTPDGNVTAFSLTHVSGTGGGPVYGVVSQMPLTTIEGVNVLDNLTYMTPRVGHDTANVGYYKTTFQNEIVTELSATSHVGMLQYGFPASSGRHILVDVSHYLPSNGGGYQSQFYANGEIEVSDDGRQYTGWGVYKGAFSEIPDYQIFFCGRFDTAPTTNQVFHGPYTDPYWPADLNAQPIYGNVSASGGRSNYLFGNRVGAVFSFAGNTTTLKSKVGVSWISSDKACSFIDDEIPHWNLNTTVSAAKSTWNQNLGTIQVSQENSTRLQMFYTGLYHTQLMPTDRTGENPHWDSSEPSYDDFYTLWDTFRCLNSLYLLIIPDRAADIIRSLIDIWRHEQFMPDGRSGNYNGQVQGGSNADNVLADAYIKGLQRGINWTDGYAAMKTDAELTPPNTFDSGDPTASVKEGRGALPDWKALGFVSPTYYRSLSRTVEYALNDYSVAQVARGVAPDDYTKYLNRSAGWQYLWQHNLTNNNFTGFLAPRYANGSRDPTYAPDSCGSCEANAPAYEALPWEYSWTIPFDMQTLIQFMGGPNTTESRLDAMFIPGLRTNGVGFGGLNGAGTTLFNPGNEPSFSTPFLYNYLSGRQYKSVLRSRQSIDTYYGNTASGLPGNSDSGALDSWMLWQMLGLYPVVTQGIYLILSPWFSAYNMTIGDASGDGTTGGVLKMTATGLSDASYYVQSLKVNGQQWNQSWVTHDDIKNGGTLEFVLGPNPVGWDTGSVPGSPGHLELGDVEGLNFTDTLPV